eukprot:5972900-Amphidinium_carterae.1
MSSSLVETQVRHPLMKVLPPESYFCWGCDDPKGTIEAWSEGKLKLLQQRTFADIYVEWARQ